jgi:polysaccharide biosynthesis/export protein
MTFVQLVTGLLLSGVLLCSAVPAAGGEHRVDVGDVLEIAVAGVPELRQRVTVQLDGSISYPLLGTFVVAGLPPSELRAKLRSALPSKVFRQRASDGREFVVVIEADHVTANIVEYRPIYVNGDVSRPGEQPYRPRMTVHQAIALSGGYEIMRFRMNNPFLDSADFRSDYESLWTEYAKEQAHIWRLKVELGEKDNTDLKILQDVPLPASTISQITRLETEQLKETQEDHQREKEFLRRGIKQADEQIVALTEQLQKDEAGLQADTQELQMISNLFSRGASTMPRLSETRRAVLWSATRKLQTASQIMTVKLQRDGFSRQLQKLDDQRRINLRLELQEAGVKLNQIRTKLQAVGEKIRYTGLVRSQLVRGAGNKPQIIVVRKNGTGRERISAEEDFELQPGDVVEVALRPEKGVILPPE